MIIKRATYPIISQDGRRNVMPADLQMIKSAGYELLPEVEDFIRQNPHQNPDVVRVLVNAMGAGEYWGSNLNGDYFPEDALCHRGQDYGYQTFYNAHAFKHHVNKDPLKSFGDVVFAAWNPLMKRVELIVDVYRDRSLTHGALDVYDKLLAGDYMNVSMGCKVKFDLCSICLDREKYQRAKASFDPSRHLTIEDAILEWHRHDPIRGLARTRAEYCVHAKTMMNKIFPDGRKVYVINPFPRFFDISFVYIGADKTARVMAKMELDKTSSPSIFHIRRAEFDIESETDKTSSLSTYVDRDMVKAATFGGEVKKADLQKISDILKTISSRYVTKIVPELERSEPGLPLELIHHLARMGLPRALGWMISKRVLLRPDEFFRLNLLADGRADLIPHVGTRVVIPSDVESRLPPPVMMAETPPRLSQLEMRRSVTGPILARRIIIVRSSGLRLEPVIRCGLRGGIFDELAGRYNTYRRLMLTRFPLGGVFGLGPLAMLARFFGPTTAAQRRLVVMVVRRPVETLTEPLMVPGL